MIWTTVLAFVLALAATLVCAPALRAQADPAPASAPAPDALADEPALATSGTTTPDAPAATLDTPPTITDSTPPTPATPATPAPPSPAAATAKAGDDVVELSPFTVTATEDKGYLAQNVLGGGRMKTSLKDLATPTSAFTAQFMDDLQINSVDDLAQYMLSTEYDYAEAGDNNQNSSVNIGKTLRVRGFAASQSINYFTIPDQFTKLDAVSIDRFEQTRGPSSVLFGLGNPGGIINATTKLANLTRASATLKVQAQSWDGLRSEIDLNQPIVKKKAALRFAAVKSQQDSWRDWQSDNETRYYGTLRWMLTPKTEMNISGETGTLDAMTNRTIVGYDAYSDWIATGRNTADTGSATTAPALAQQSIGYNTSNYIVLITGTDAGIASGMLANWRTKTHSLYQTVSTHNAIYPQTFPNGASVIANNNDKLAITDFNTVPMQTSLYGPGFATTQSYNYLTANITHSFTKDFYIDLAAFRASYHRNSDKQQTGNDRFLEVDTSPTLPNGLPNPNVGRYYIEYGRQDTPHKQTDNALRAQLSYTKDLKKWGRHTFSAVLQYTDGDSSQLQRNEYITSPNAPLVNTGNNLYGAAQAQNLLERRTYLGTRVLNTDGTPATAANGTPLWTLTGLSSNQIVMNDWRNWPIGNRPDQSGALSGASTAGRVYQTQMLPDGSVNSYIRSYRGTDAIAMLQSSFLANRLFTTLGASYDTRTDYNSTLQVVPLPGFTYTDALTNTTVPTGYVTPVAGATGAPTHGRAYVAGIVYHATPWLSLSYNKAANNGIPNPGGRVDSFDGTQTGIRPPVSRGKSDDAGIKLDLFTHRLFATLTWFHTVNLNDFQTDTVATGIFNNINVIWAAYGSPSFPNTPALPPGTAGSYAALRETSTGITFDSDTKGIELELTANPTDNLRLRLIYSYEKTRNSNMAAGLIAYVNRWRSFWLNSETGDYLPSNSNNLNGSTTTTITQQVQGIDSLIATNYLAASSHDQVGQIPHKLAANIMYDFSTGVLRGFSLGGTLKYYSPPVTGYWSWNYGNNTFGPVNSIKGYAQVTANLQASYKRKLTLFGKSIMWTTRLQLINLFNDQTVYPVRQAMINPNTNSTLTTMYRFTDPRSIQATTQFKF